MNVRSAYKILQIFIFSVFFGINIHAQPNTPTPQSHAHNDYAKKKRAKLTDALSLGFLSVEIDVYPYKGELKVAHFPIGLKKAGTLEELYFKPLQKWVEEYKTVYKNSNRPVIFMIDIKRDAAQSYQLLNELCEKYPNLVTSFHPTAPEKVNYRFVEILLSGNKPYKELIADTMRLMRLDGRLGDLQDVQKDTFVVKRVSMRYPFKWKGSGEISAKELEQLRVWVKQAHDQHRKIRFWAMPNKESVWQLLLDEGVDWMNVDAIEKYRNFRMKYVPKIEE